MFDEIIYNGLWWLPENPDKRIPGQLHITPYDKSHIELQGEFSNKKQLSMDFNPNIILGLSTNGKCITLEKCILTNKTINFLITQHLFCKMQHRSFQHFG
jgi:hypothetical protein